MIIKKAEFVTTAVKPDQYPESILPEFAMAGRSNVGKSSFINAMTNRRSLAKVGATPGKTRVINFFNVNDEVMLVDLPGYGYAKVAKQEKERWGKIIEIYLNTRNVLKGIIMLVDIRHEPTGDDVTMAEYVKATGKSLIVVATKADKISRAHYKKQADTIRKILNLDERINVIPFSSEKKIGIDETWTAIESLLNRE